MIRFGLSVKVYRVCKISIFVILSTCYMFPRHRNLKPKEQGKSFCYFYRHVMLDLYAIYQHNK